MVRREAKPLIRVDALRSDLARGAAQAGALMRLADVELRAGVTEVGGFLHPVRGLGEVARQALAGGIHEAEIELGKRVALLSGFEIPEGGLSEVRHAAHAVGEVESERELRVGHAAVGEGLG